ncbi:stemmadenine O-acetyltransferase [Ziziphus jujuba]|uniref:Stemmadenine O-acetyltransferase n=2 Tax=Ziziphus jujuba TaxID=326968 RepID=A0A6P3ZAP3_ZIZJJ|nr:stemmadenine O-acetyltransferase [Ziziphus jujuba]KAH7545012.1 hypothetical protein FEM48_Zijuj01G0048200 [Ziziphus jujuba var. spinosa]
MEVKVEIFSKEIIKPSSSTPDHLRNLELSMLDRRVPPIYVPILLFYTTCSDIDDDYASISSRLKNSLSQTLTSFYPLAGRMRSQQALVDCNDEGVLFLEAEVPNVDLSAFLRNPENNALQLFPFNPFESSTETVITGVQVNVFSCGGIGIGLCISHKIVDGTAVDYFLKAWSATARGINDDDRHQHQLQAPRLDSALLFPPKGMNILMAGSISKEKISTKRFIFNATKLNELKAKVGIQNPSRVESVTALIWKSAMEAVKVNSGKEKLPRSISTHVVNLRERTVPPLPNHVFGNLWQVAAAFLLEEKEDVELGYLAGLIRQAQKEIDSHYVSELQGDEGLAKAYKPYKEVRSLTSDPQLQCYMFGSWTRFGFYGTDFGWGSPTWVCTTGMPVKNGIILMSTPSGDGIEAWITLAEQDMVEFQGNPELSHFVSPTY